LLWLPQILRGVMSSDSVYSLAEVKLALAHLKLDAHLSRFVEVTEDFPSPVLTRPQLGKALKDAGVSDALVRDRIRTVLDGNRVDASRRDAVL
jgi:hypothetical protein